MNKKFSELLETVSTYKDFNKIGLRWYHGLNSTKIKKKAEKLEGDEEVKLTLMLDLKNIPSQLDKIDNQIDLLKKVYPHRVFNMYRSKVYKGMFFGNVEIYSEVETSDEDIINEINKIQDKILNLNYDNNRKLRILKMVMTKF